MTKINRQTCPHKEPSTVAYGYCVTRDDGTKEYDIHLEVSCGACGMPFDFVGEYQTKRLERSPAILHNGSRLYVPIVPRFES